MILHPSCTAREKHHTHTDCRYAARATTDEQACTQKHTYAALCLHTQTRIQGHLSLWCFFTHWNTHTCWTRRPDGITAWAVGLSHSGDLISHCFFSFTHPFSTLIFDNPRLHFLFFFLSDLFICSLIAGPFILQTMHDNGQLCWGDCSIYNKLSILWRLSLTPEVLGQKSSNCDAVKKEPTCSGPVLTSLVVTD